jgi:ABC-type Na+ transport system ATPase subunit NatA
VNVSISSAHLPDDLGVKEIVRTAVCSYSKGMRKSSIASIVIRRPSRMLLKMMTRHSSFSFFENPSLV